MAAKWFSSPIAIERLALTVTFLFGYMALIVNLSCLPVSSAALVDEGVLTLGQLGNIFAASNGAVVAGKIINGGLSDFLGARKTFILTEILVPLFTGMVSLSHNWVVILFLWCFVRFCHSAGFFFFRSLFLFGHNFAKLSMACHCKINTCVVFQR